MTKSSLESMLFRLDSSTNQTGKLLPPLEIHRDGQVSKACQRSKDFYLSCLQNGVSIVPLDKFLNIDENDPPATKLQTIRARQLDAKIQDPTKIIEILCEKLSLKSDFFDEELENAFEATLEVSLPNNETKSIMGRGGSVHAARANASQNMINFLRNEGTLGIVGDELDDIIDESSEFTPIEMIIKFTGKRNLSPCYSFEQIRNDYFVCILKIVFREDLMKFSMGFSNRKLEAKRKAAKSMIQLIKNDLKIYYGQCKLLEGIDSSESYHSSYIIPSIPNAVPCSNENSGCNDNDSGGNGSSPKKLNTDFISLLKIFIDKNGGSSDFNFIALDKSDDFNFQCTVTVKNSSGKVLHEASGKGSNKKEAKKSACQQVLELLTAPSSPEKVKDDEIQIDEPITPDESLELEVEPTPSPLKPTKTCDPLQPRRISFAEEPTIIEIPNREMLKREQAEYKRLKRKLERKSRNRASAMLPQYVPQYSKSQSNGHFSYDQRGGYYDQFGCYYPIYPNQSGYNRNFYSGYNNQYYCQNTGYRYY